MRSRTLREGSVGLLIIFGVLVFGGLALWIKGIKFGDKSYKIIGDFPDVNGVQLGDGVRYRGLQVGRVENIEPATNGVDVVIEIDSSDLLIPKNAILKARSAGLVGESFIEIVPDSQLPTSVANMSPVADNCDPELIVCNNARLQAEKGITLDDLLPFTLRFSKAFSDPEFVGKIDTTVNNTGIAASEVAGLSKKTGVLIEELQQEVNKTSGELVSTANSFQTTAEQINRLTNNVERLIAQNEGSLNNTLNSISTTSDRLENLVVKLDQTVDQANVEELAGNLDELTTNATVASENLKNITENFGNDQSLVSLQKTLDSARVTFDNAQKITSDLESITGDPTFIENVRKLVNGLSNLVSTTEQLEQQIQTTEVVDPVRKEASNLDRATQ